MRKKNFDGIDRALRIKRRATNGGDVGGMAESAGMGTGKAVMS
jgi:hypothetical protein